MVSFGSLQSWVVLGEPTVSVSLQRSLIINYSLPSGDDPIGTRSGLREENIRGNYDSVRDCCFELSWGRQV